MKNPLCGAILASIFLASVARADDPSGGLGKFSISDAKKKDAQSGAASVGGSYIVQGESDPALSRHLLVEAMDLIHKNSKDVVHFVNDKGCIPNGSSNVPLNDAALTRVLNSTVQKTEVIFNAPHIIKLMTGRDDAWAFGVPAGLRPGIEKTIKAKLGPNAILKLGTPGMNLIVLKVKPTGGGARFAHEFLHVVLRQLDNPALGGGAYKSKECGFVAKTHHELTDYLAGKDPKAQPENIDAGWSQYKQSPTEWSPSKADVKPECKIDMSGDDKKCDQPGESGYAGAPAP